MEAPTYHKFVWTGFLISSEFWFWAAFFYLLGLTQCGLISQMPLLCDAVAGKRVAGWQQYASPNVRFPILDDIPFCPATI